MKRLAIILCLLATPAFAQKLSDTVLMPRASMDAIQQYFGDRPLKEVLGMFVTVTNCMSVQTPDKDGVIRDSGQCKSVTEARQAQEADKAAAVKAALDAAAKPKSDPKP